MSGGVDSAVAAARAVDAGHDVVGVHLALSRMPGTLRTGSRGCCTIEDSMDAQRAANIIGIPYYVWDFSDRFKADVVDDFVAEYSAGRTPNPCLRCNERIKFAALMDKALAPGFDAVATGHYASIVTDAAGNRQLHRAAAWAKDQSYVLGVLTAEQLRHAMFPLGSTPSKAEVRAEAAARGLGVAAKPDSHDICFIPDGDTRGWLAEQVGAEPGSILDRSGAVIGSHEGAHAFTVGQRKGLNIGFPADDAAVPPSEGLPPSPRELPQGHGELVLIVDDEATIRQITRQTLEANGYRTLGAANGREAIDLIESGDHVVDIVVTDMMMPVMDGASTSAYLEENFPDLPVIAASGLNSNGGVARAVGMGVARFLPKPYTASLLLTTIRDTLLEQSIDGMVSE
jgi:tRNA (5-methylaminomethyl-2-thiouridylate)-methyltransferase